MIIAIHLEDQFTHCQRGADDDQTAEWIQQVRHLQGLCLIYSAMATMVKLEVAEALLYLTGQLQLQACYFWNV